MNATNPFQVPSCLQRANLERRRRERFRKGVVVALAAMVTLLVVLLIEGCVGEHSKNMTSLPTPASPRSQAASSISSIPKPALPALPPVAVSAPAKTVLPNSTHANRFYVVKSGDTLGHIAQLYHTTPRTLKAINGLVSENLTVGVQLKLPPV